MNKLSSAILIISTAVFTLFSFNVAAEQPLTRDLVQQFVKTTKKIEPLVKSSPGVEKKFTKAMLSGKKDVLSLLDTLPNSGQFKSAIKSEGFENSEQFVDISLRIMGAVFSSQMTAMPQGMTVDDYLNSLKAQVESMKKQGLPVEATKQMEAALKEQQTNMLLMKNLAKKASKADVKFATDNLDWLIQLMPSEAGN